MAGCLEMVGPEVATSQTLTWGLAGASLQEQDTGPFHLLLHLRMLVCRKALCDHTGCQLCPYYQAVSRASLGGDGAQTLRWRSGPRRKRGPQHWPQGAHHLGGPRAGLCDELGVPERF